MLLAVLLAAALIYGVPVLIETGLIRHHANPWLVYVVLSDLPGCALLFGLGLRRAAVIVYLATAVFEAAALTAGVVPESMLLLTTNAAPAIVLAVVLIRMALRSSVLHEESV